MNIRVVIAIAVMLATAAVSEARAATYNFYWTGNPALDSNLVFSQNSGATAAGVIDINALPGESFNLSDVGLLNIQVSGPGFTSFTINTLQFLTGSISSDGLSATLSDFFYNGGEIFGCVLPDTQCLSDAFGRNIRIVDGRNVFNFGYNSSENALASYRLTAVSAVPLPAALPLLGVGLAGLGAANWFRRRLKPGSLALS